MGDTNIITNENHLQLYSCRTVFFVPWRGAGKAGAGKAGAGKEGDGLPPGAISGDGRHGGWLQ
jgi:hypothetical protein